MTTPSNLYAEKVFAEHPISLWALDDSVDYRSIIPELGRNMSLWLYDEGIDTIDSYANQTVVDNTIGIDFPRLIFPNSYINQVSVLEDLGGSPEVFMQGQVFSPSNFDPFTKTFSIGAYVFTPSKAITITVGFVYVDSQAQQHYTKRSFYIGDVSQWAYVSEMFSLPADFSALTVVLSAQFSGTDAYDFLIHGLSLGQLSEQFNVESLGVDLIDINDEETYPVFSTAINGSIAYSYGLQSRNAYYLANSDGKLCATNSGAPLVFGTSSSTRIIKNYDGMPSVIIPGLGFFNEDGRHKDLTLEMWLRIQTKTTTSVRILGPIASDDGLYINDSFLILNIGNQSKAYYINEWDRPMLLALRYSDELVSLVINGEEVISIDITTDTFSFPEKYITVGETIYNQDWIGVYASDDVPYIEIDCIGIYPYIVPAIMEKRRLVYGQGVSNPPGISSADLESMVAADYTFSKYTKNYSYPDIGKWQQGIGENLVVDNQAISLPQYELPQLVFNNRTSGEWYADMQHVTGLFGPALEMRPTTNSSLYDWSSTNGYIYFETLNMMSQDTKAFYGLFESDENDTSKQTLFYLENELTRDSLEISMENGVVEYSMRYLNTDGSMSDPTVLFTNEGTTSEHVLGQFLFVGVDIAKFVEAFGGRAAALFGNKKQLKVYVAGKKTFTDTFSGKIYRVGFCTARNLLKISKMFTYQGVAASYNALEALPEYVYDAGDVNFTNNPSYVDSETGSIYWEKVADGGDSYFGNLNTDFEEVIDGGSVYSILVDEVLSHIASYTLMPKEFLGVFSIDVAVNSYWQDYVPLSYFGKYVYDGKNAKYYDLDFIQYNISYPAIKRFINHKYDTSNSVVKTYVSFDYIKNKSTIDNSYYTSISYASDNNVVEPDANWYKRLYEITDNTIIYPPPGVDFKSIALVLHVEVLSNGITDNPVNIQSLQLSSQALNAFSANSVGTKYGQDIYPYRKAGAYVDYKGRNPFTIYKSSMPYLYLTEKSGIKINSMSNIGVERGLSIPINKNKVDSYELGGMQFNVRYTGEYFPASVTEVMQIQSNGKFTRIYMQRDSEDAQRARLVATDAETGLPDSNITFYINGRLVNTAVIDINMWHMLGIIFAQPLSFSGQTGAIRMTGPLTWNNLMQYRTKASGSKTIYRKWFSILTVDSVDVPWNYWYDPNPANTTDLGYNWRDVLFVSSEGVERLNGKSAYEKYVGTGRIVADTDNVFRLNSYQYTLYKDIVWKSSSVQPV